MLPARSPSGIALRRCLFTFAVSWHDRRREVTFLYKLTDGVCPKSHGMNVANMAGVTRSVVIRYAPQAN